MIDSSLISKIVLFLYTRSWIKVSSHHFPDAWKITLKSSLASKIGQCCIPIHPENFRKPENFLSFQGVKKCNIGLKRLNCFAD